MKYVALRRISIDDTSYKVGDSVSEAHAKRILKEFWKEFIGTGKAEAPVDTPPTAPETPRDPVYPTENTPDTPPTPPEDQKTDTPPSDVDNDPEDEDKQEIGDPDTPPTPPTSETPDTDSPEAQELLKKKMWELAEQAKGLGLSMIVGEKKEALVSRIIKAQRAQ